MPPTNSQVPRIQLNKDETISLEVSIYGFEKDTRVEISGQATQENGAIAKFYSTLIMPEVKNEESVLVTLNSISVSSEKKFAAHLPITVVARAAEVWISTLVEVEGPEKSSALKTPLSTDTPTAIWQTIPDNPKLQVVPANSTRPAPLPDNSLLRHGTWWDRVKPESLYEVAAGRFTRLFPYLPTASFEECDLKKLAHAMIAPEEPEREAKDDPEENQTIPAAYTYLGQFVDHDLTFDPISHLREALTPAQLQALVDFRTPRFDLDNLYGRGPDDQPYMYEDNGICMRLGERMSGDPFDPGAVQLPRGPGGRALIGDPRNDENRIVAQLHAIFLRFHNEVVRKLGGKDHVSFQKVREQVRWHYQWILVNDFLPKILQKQIYESVFPGPYSPVTTIPGLRENDLELMPVEFSVAAYRFGHSMVRPQYQLNEKIKDRPIFSDHTADLGGFRPIPANWAIDWQYFIDLDHRAEQVPGKPQLSYKIDTSLVHPLGRLPSRIARDPSDLALRNLERGTTFQLPSGQSVATALGLSPIPDKDLVIGKAVEKEKRTPLAEIAEAFADNAPLWAYILSEAQVTSWDASSEPDKDKVPVRLGPVGGRLVAEVFASLLRGDPTSYLNAYTKFVPIKSFSRGGEFGLAELINVALGRTR
jgi:hypothetical protein